MILRYHAVAYVAYIDKQIYGYCIFAKMSQYDGFHVENKDNNGNGKDDFEGENGSLGVGYNDIVYFSMHSTIPSVNMNIKRIAQCLAVTPLS